MTLKLSFWILRTITPTTPPFPNICEKVVFVVSFDEPEPRPTFKNDDTCLNKLYPYMIERIFVIYPLVADIDDGFRPNYIQYN